MNSLKTNNTEAGVSTGNQPDPAILLRGLLNTIQSTLEHINGSWEFQLLNNADALTAELRDLLSEEELHKFRQSLDVLIKKPLRRQMGRVRAVARSLEEVKRYIP